MAVVRDLRVLLRFQGFRRLLAVRLLSQGADGVFQVALAAYVVFSPSGRPPPRASPRPWPCCSCPTPRSAPSAGVLLDRWRRRQVFLYGNLLRALMASVTALLILVRVPDWLLFVAALCVTGVNRFVLAGLSAALPRVVDTERLVIANSLPDRRDARRDRGRRPGLRGPAGRRGLGRGGGARGRRPLPVRGPVGPVHRQGTARPGACVGAPRLSTALSGTVADLVAGVRHLLAPARRDAAWALTGMFLMRFCYGGMLVMLLMLCRYHLSSTTDEGLALLGLALGASGAGFFAAAVLTPWAAGRMGPGRWIVTCAAAAAVLEPLGLPFASGPLLAGAFVLGLSTQGAKISTDTIVQASVDDDFRGRIFSVYDVLFNVAFVGAAAVAALVLPSDGRSVTLVVTIAVIYAAVAVAMARFERQ